MNSPGASLSFRVEHGVRSNRESESYQIDSQAGEDEDSARAGRTEQADGKDGNDPSGNEQ